ncbi:MAG: primosomal protein N' [Candidatus Eremiobacteraeota bacterium]|nr:primosomal protein N' [Candidatus Eremiobacteraeota bacterium]
MASGRAIDVLVHLRTSRFDRPLTYEVPAGIDVRIGDVVRVPLHSRSAYGYVVSPLQEISPNGRALRPIASRADVPRAFDETGLALARFIADRWVCTLGEALGAIVLAGAIPRFEEKLVVVAEQPSPERYRGVPPRLLRLIWQDLSEGFTTGALLQHPEARRAAERAELLRHLSALVRGGHLRRIRTAGGPRVGERAFLVLVPGEGAVAGKRAEALVAAVREAGSMPRADALLAGFSRAVIARAVRAGALREERRLPQPRRARTPLAAQRLTATAEQRAALARLERLLSARSFGEMLLFGVTGSGKTFVYLEAIARVAERGGRAIVLVPEISLTPQTARRFEAVFGERVAVLHSALSERERFEAWQAAARGEVDVVVGARSAVFAPLEDVRMIVVDEAHETSYKQETTPRYDAVAVARERMRLAGGVLVLGSATPPLGAYARARAGEIPLAELPYRAAGGAALPAVQVVDMAAEFTAGHRRAFSRVLIEGLDRRLERGEKTILFVNRRGTARFALCRACGYVPDCTRCTTSLAVHRQEGLLRCHYCDRRLPLPPACPRCGNAAFREFGIGTEGVAGEVGRLWPDARVIRMDSDTTTRVGDHARILSAFEERGDVLVGTQMVAKGLDFPSVTLVGVVAADVGLHLADYRAAERTFDLLAQVCGRSGRAGPGEAIVQTYSPEHPAIVCAARHDYEGFAQDELPAREALRYPPFWEFAYVGVAGRLRRTVEATAERYAGLLREAEAGEILGPAPHPLARLAEEWRWRIAIKAPSLDPARGVIREQLLPLALKDRATRLVVAIDP